MATSPGVNQHLFSVPWMATLSRAVPVQARQLSVETDMKPVVACLQRHGLSDKDIVKVSHLMSHPLTSLPNPHDI